MTKIAYTDEQMIILLNHPCITKCSSKYITFTPECRKEAVRLYEEVGLSPSMIFETLSFPDFIIHSTLPKDSLARWRRIVTAEGYGGLGNKKKGRKKKEGSTEGMTHEEQILYLQAKVAYLEYENDFLRLLRAEKN